MSKPVSVEWAETGAELYEQYRGERNVERRKRLQVLWLVRRGERVEEAGRQAGVGARTVERWLGWYRSAGLTGVLGRVRGHGSRGNPHRLSVEQQAQLVAQCASGAFRTYDEARAWVAAEYGVEYRYGGIYAVLSRLGVHPRVPRPVAERADAATQAAWKQGG